MSKRSNGEGTISKRSSDGSWIGQITLGYDEFGKAVRKACSAKTQAECKKKLDSLKKQFLTFKVKSVHVAKKSYFDYLLTDWIEEKKFVEQLEDSTIQTHISRINCYFKDFFKNIELQKIDSKLLSDFYAQLNSKNLSAEKMTGIKSRLHILRHTNITNLITNGTDIKNRAGHTRIETTMSYTHPSEELDRKVANIF